MAQAGRLLADVFGHLDRLALAGMSTMQVNDLVDDFIVHTLAARPASKGQYGYAYALNAAHVRSCRSRQRRADGEVAERDVQPARCGVQHIGPTR